MKRSWNGALWLGFLLVLAGLFSYVPVFAQFPLTRDFPWVNLLLFAAGLALLGVGVVRTYRRPERFRGRYVGPALSLLSLAGVGLFCWGIFYVARQLPPSASAPHAGQKAPDFSLPDQDNKPVALADLLAPAAGGTPPRGVLLIFYRGHW